MLCLFFLNPHNLATSSALMSLNSPSLLVHVMMDLYCCSSTNSSSRNCHRVILDSMLIGLVVFVVFEEVGDVCSELVFCFACAVHH